MYAIKKPYAYTIFIKISYSHSTITKLSSKILTKASPLVTKAATCGQTIMQTAEAFKNVNQELMTMLRLSDNGLRALISSAQW